MIHAYIPKYMYAKGQARFLEGLQLTELVKVFYFDDIKELCLIDEANSVIIAGISPDKLKFIVHDKVYYCFTSPLGQADLSSSQWPSPEMDILHQVINLKSQGKIRDCIVSSYSVAFAYDFIYLPRICKFHDKDVKFTLERRNYGFLGNNLRKHKNAHNQIAAMSLLKPNDPIVVSEDFPCYYFKLFHREAKFLPILLKSDIDYYNEISTHRLGFQCSFSESFDYMAFEYCLSGVPVIGSAVLDWYPYKECIVKNPDDVKEIYNVAQQLINNKCFYSKISEKLSIWAKEFNARSIDSAVKDIHDRIL